MKKLRLEMEKMEVQSFPTTPESETLLGTVLAAAAITVTLCGGTCIGPSCCKTEWEARTQP
jgi:hypothetical protein